MQQWDPRGLSPKRSFDTFVVALGKHAQGDEGEARAQRIHPGKEQKGGQCVPSHQYPWSQPEEQTESKADELRSA